jgi:zinc finger FYVE domain-containing protein 1
MLLFIFQVLNDRFSGELENNSAVLFPDQYFTCPVKCLSCEKRCESSMGHLKEQQHHSCAQRCR